MSVICKFIHQMWPSCLLPRDLIHYYELFLKLKGFGQWASLIKQEKAEPLPKFIDGFFVRLHAKLEVVFYFLHCSCSLGKHINSPVKQVPFTTLELYTWIETARE